MIGIIKQKMAPPFYDIQIKTNKMNEIISQKNYGLVVHL